MDYDQWDKRDFLLPIEYLLPSPSNRHWNKMNIANCVLLKGIGSADVILRPRGLDL